MKAQKIKYKARQAQKLADIQKHNDEAFDVMEFLGQKVYPVFEEKKYTRDQAKAYLRSTNLKDDDAIEAVLYYYPDEFAKAAKAVSK
ncbi:unnamed protein product [Phytophthora fragariaefolia]|uniref:Unnamed protein product n=1 Tax=Phytophthora fragariaefolia TaxID=1490495 RepID=A0A9W7DAA8_9STRA|nr:unnamed protein product [Phytophthora fragariaefolia]